MCGICGVVGLEDRGLLKKMTDILTHRGPDDFGFFSDGNIMLGNRRLSIIDLKTGHQPIHNEDETVWVVLNGEIYNYQQLKTELESLGHRFYTQTDTETLAHLYEQFGDDFVEKLRGMFAFAIWDIKKKKLLLVRDRLGIKPLYYATFGKIFFFSSEMKSILLYEEFKRKTNYNSLYHFMNIGFFPDPESIFTGIKQLLPSHMLVYRDKKFKTKKYWNVNISEERNTEEYFSKKLLQLLEEAVRIRMISDVPLGLYISGGVDSTSMLALMKKFSDRPIKTFSIGFGFESDEIGDAKSVAEHFATDHTEIIVDGSKILEAFPQIIWHFDEPTRITTPLYFLSKEAKKKVTVALQGLGGDELFAGYKRHRIIAYRDIMPRNMIFLKTIAKLVPHKNIRKIFRAISAVKDEYFYVVIRNTLAPEQEERVFSKNFLSQKLQTLQQVLSPYFKSVKSKNLLNKVLLVELQTNLPFDLLKITDRETMAASIESRVPYIDHKLVEFSFKIPVELKMMNGKGKYIFKKAIKNLVPESVLKKKKQGLTLEPKAWFSQFKDIAVNILDKKTVEKANIFKYTYIQKLLQRPFNPQFEFQYQRLWRILAFEIWRKIYLEDSNVLSPNLSLDRFLE
jgi:asparagine synthase (glutamine-hydrolysing)